MATRRKAIFLYRQLLREAEKLPSYNFRMYAARKIRDTFREKRMTSNFDKIDHEIMNAQNSLELLRRQVIIGHLYTTGKLVIEKKPTLHPQDD